MDQPNLGYSSLVKGTNIFCDAGPYQGLMCYIPRSPLLFLAAIEITRVVLFQLYVAADDIPWTGHTENADAG